MKKTKIWQYSEEYPTVDLEKILFISKYAGEDYVHFFDITFIINNVSLRVEVDINDIEENVEYSADAEYTEVLEGILYPVYSNLIHEWQNYHA